MDLARDIQIGIGSDHAKKGAAAVNRELDGIKRKAERTGRAGEKAAGRHSRALRTLAKVASATAIALAAIRVGRGVIETQVRFGQAISDLSALTGAAGEDLEFLRQRAAELGSTTTLSASQAADAFRLIASAKPDLLENVQALSAVTAEAIALSEATGDDLPTAAATLGSALNQFSAGADQAGRFINVLAAGAKLGASEVRDTAEALEQSGTIAAQAGLSFEETNASLQLLSTFAIKGSKAGNQFRGTLLALAAAGRDEFNPEAVGLVQALNNLEKANLSTKEATDLFGRENVATARILIANADKVAKLTENLTGTTIAYEQQAIRVDNLAGDIKGLKSAYEGLEIVVGSQLNGALRALVQNATEGIRALSNNPIVKKGFTNALDFIHRIVQDIAIGFGQWKQAVAELLPDAVVFESIWTQAVDNVVAAVKFLWEQFVIGGPANLKLGFTLMIAAADRFRIALIEKIRIAVFSVLLGFQNLKHGVIGVFDDLQIIIGRTIDNILGKVQQRIFNVARNLANLGFEDAAEQAVQFAKAIGEVADFEEDANKEAAENESIRAAQVAIIDELIAETKAQAEAQREASRAAVEGAIAERDATLETIKALRTKRQEIIDGANAGGGGVASGGGGGGGTFSSARGDVDLKSPAEKAAEEYERLGDIQQSVVDNMANGIADFAARGSSSFKEFAASVIQDLIRIAVRAQAVGFFTNLFANFGAPKAIGGLGAAGASFTGGGNILHAQEGAQFQVGGSGGVDSQLVAFRASPNENVSITRPEQKSGPSSGNVTINFNQSIVADGADAEKFQAQVPLMMDRARKMAVADVIQLRDKGVFR